MSFLGGKGNNNISIGKAKSKFSFCYHLGCSTTARLLQAHLGCSQTDAGSQHTTRGNTTPILPTSCSLPDVQSGCTLPTIHHARRMQPDGCREPTHHQREHHTDTANIMQPARRSKRMHLANYPTHHLGCRGMQAKTIHSVVLGCFELICIDLYCFMLDGCSTTDGAPEGCRGANTTSGASTKQRCSTIWEPARASTIIEPARRSPPDLEPEGCREQHTILEHSPLFHRYNSG